MEGWSRGVVKEMQNAECKMKGIREFPPIGANPELLSGELRRFWREMLFGGTPPPGVGK